MGWGHCGKNKQTGEEMGYCVEGVCSNSDCDKKIDHGLSYVCGGMHGGSEHGCGKYFCSTHLNYHDCDVSQCQLCDVCLSEQQKEPPKGKEG